MKFSTPEASSARSERLFSGGKLVLETKATVLLMKTLKKYYRGSPTCTVSTSKNSTSTNFSTIVLKFVKSYT